MALTDNLVEFWTLNNTLVGINGNTLVSPDGLTHYVAGKIGQAWDVADVIARVLRQTPGPINPGDGDWSLSIWFYVSDPEALNASRIFALSDGTTTKLAVFSDIADAVIYVNSTRFLSSPLGTWITTGWNHIVWTSDADGYLNLWLNGEPSSENNSVGGLVIGSLAIPNLYLGGSGTVTGSAAAYEEQVDGFGWWSRKLTDLEIAELYAAGAGWEPAVTSGAINIRIAHILTCRQCGARMTRNYDFHAEESDATQ